MNVLLVRFLVIVYIVCLVGIVLFIIWGGDIFSPLGISQVKVFFTLALVYPSLALFYLATGKL